MSGFVGPKFILVMLKKFTIYAFKWPIIFVTGRPPIIKFEMKKPPESSKK